ncbi:MAG: hypothetical protein HZY79_05020 [Rhodoblastus sp.]|nr:MAG: hypothetical protein HZY79_05020 [Rhodoblastus sp.]
MLKLFTTAIAAAFLLAATPVVAPLFGADAGAQARPAHGYKKAHKRHHRHAKRGKWQYQYVPTSSGRAGAWR